MKINRVYPNLKSYRNKSPLTEKKNVWQTYKRKRINSKAFNSKYGKAFKPTVGIISFPSRENKLTKVDE